MMQTMFPGQGGMFGIRFMHFNIEFNVEMLKNEIFKMLRSCVVKEMMKY